MGETRRAVPKAQQYVYRNVAVEIGRGRFARDGWSLEPWFDRGALTAPHTQRATEGKMVIAKPKHPPKDGPRQYGPTARWTPENINRKKGLYVLIRTEVLQTGGPLFVIARCHGLDCDGSEQRFSVHRWQKEDRLRGCHKCASTLRRKERREAQQSAPRARGYA